MKFSKRMNLFLCGFLALLFLSNRSMADTAQMHATFVLINTILTQTTPLINLAQRQENPQARVRFQFDRLRQDISKIQAGINEVLHRVSIQPRSVKPLSGDYLPDVHTDENKSTLNHEDAP